MLAIECSWRDESRTRETWKYRIIEKRNFLSEENGIKLYIHVSRGRCENVITYGDN